MSHELAELFDHRLRSANLRDVTYGGVADKSKGYYYYYYWWYIEEKDGMFILHIPIGNSKRSYYTLVAAQERLRLSFDAFVSQFAIKHKVEERIFGERWGMLKLLRKDTRMIVNMTLPAREWMALKLLAIESGHRGVVSFVRTIINEALRDGDALQRLDENPNLLIDKEKENDFAKTIVDHAVRSKGHKR